MLGGFGLCGIPENLIAALVRRRITGLHTISNNMGVDGFGMGLMLEAGMIASHIGSYVGENRGLEQMVLKEELKLTLVPRGTLAERVRAGGAGIPAFYVPTGLGTIVAEEQGDTRDCRAELCARDSSASRCCPGEGVERRSARQPDLPQDLAELQSGDGDCCKDDHR